MSSPNSLLDWTEARQNHAIDCFVLMPAPRCACRRQAGQTGTAGGADLVPVRLRIGGQPQGARLRAEPGRTRRAGAARARGRAGIRHLLTRPYRTQTNGKAERFIQTLLVEWAYLRPYATIPNASEPCRDGFASSISSAPTPELGDKPPWAVFVNKFRGNYS